MSSSTPLTLQNAIYPHAKAHNLMLKEVHNPRFGVQQEPTCPQAQAMPRLLCFLPSDMPSAGGCVMRMTPTRHTGMAAIVALQGRRGSSI